MQRRIPISCLCLVMLALAPFNLSAQKTASARVVRSIHVVDEKGVPEVEIVSNVPIAPHLRALDSPPRLVIDLPNSRLALTEEPGETRNENILAMHVSQSRENPPAIRIVLDLLASYGYTSFTEGDRLLVRLRPPEDPNAGKNLGSQPTADFSLANDGAVVQLAGASGSAATVGGRSGAGSSVTAEADTAILQLPRGGEVRVCPGTTVSVTVSKSKRDLMFGMSTGAIETHYSLPAATDAVLTPDFRIMFAGPGEFDFAISADSHGNTCVRALKGNTSSAVVSELMGRRIYQVRPKEEAVFRSGQIDRVDGDVPLSCGCPPPSALLRAHAPSIESSPEPEQPSTAQTGTGSGLPSTNAAPPTEAGGRSNGPAVVSLSTSQPHAVHVQVDAPFVFNAPNRAAGIPPPPIDAIRQLPVEESPERQVRLDVLVEPPAGKPKAQHRGIFGRVRGFFSAIFH